MFVGFFAWETYFRDNLMYEQVVALSTDKEKGEIITENDLHTINVEVNSVGGAIKKKEQIIGKATLVDIPSNIPISEYYFADPDITPLKDQFIMAIPSDWIYGFPQSVRAKDKLFFYEVKAGGSVADDLIIENNDRPAIENSGEYEFVYSSIARYVKDGSNREVVNMGETRDEGSSTVSQIEVIITKEELKDLENRIKKGSKFIILYSEG